MTFHPIGHVVGGPARPEDTPIQSLRATDERASIVLLDEFADGLEGLDGFDYAWVISHLDRAPATTDLRVVPFLLRATGERTGVFSTRYPGRPNPIGLSVIRVLAVEGPVIHFAGVDLCDGTPVLDIKPWEPHLDVPGHGSGTPALDRIRGGWYERSGAAESSQRYPDPERT